MVCPSISFAVENLEAHYKYFQEWTGQNCKNNFATKAYMVILMRGGGPTLTIFF